MYREHKYIKISVFNVFAFLLLPIYFTLENFFFISKFVVFPISFGLIITILLLIGNIKYIYLVKKEMMFFSIWTIWSGSSLVFAKNMESYMEFFHIFLGTVIIFIFIFTVSTFKRINIIIKILKFVYAILALIGIFQVLNGQKPLVTFSNANRLQTSLTLIMPILLGELLRGKFRVDKLLNVILVLMTAFISISAKSRLNVFAIAIQIGVFLFLKLRCLKMQRIPKVFLGIVGVILILSLLTYSIIPIITLTGVPIEEQFHGKTRSMHERLFMIQEGWKVFIDTNFLGTGAGNLRVRESIDEKYVNETRPSLHNFFVQLLATYGIIIFLLFIYMYYKLYQNYKQIYDTTNIDYVKNINDSLFIFLTIFPIISNSPSYLFSYRPFYIIFGFYIAFVNITKFKMLSD